MKLTGVNWSTSRVDQDCFFILETLARELMLVARLRGSPPKPQGNRYVCKQVITLCGDYVGSPM